MRGSAAARFEDGAPRTAYERPGHRTGPIPGALSAVILKGYTGMRWGEIVGLEAKCARRDNVRVEWQLYELDTGELIRCPPKDDSYRTIDTPE